MAATTDAAQPDGELDGVPDGTSAAPMLDSPLAPEFVPEGPGEHPPLEPITLQQDGRAATKFIEYCKALRVCAIQIDPTRIQPRGGSPR